MGILHQWREKIYMSIEPAPIKSNKDIRSFFPIQNDTPALNPSQKRKHPSIITSTQSQSQLFRYQFTQSTTEPTPPEDPPSNEYVLPPDIQQKIKRRESHRNCTITKQSNANTTYQQRIRQFFLKQNPNDAPKYLPTKLRL